MKIFNKNKKLDENFKLYSQNKAICLSTFRDDGQSVKYKSLVKLFRQFVLNYSDGSSSVMRMFLFEYLIDLIRVDPVVVGYLSNEKLLKVLDNAVKADQSFKLIFINFMLKLLGAVDGLSDINSINGSSNGTPQLNLRDHMLISYYKSNFGYILNFNQQLNKFHQLDYTSYQLKFNAFLIKSKILLNDLKSFNIYFNFNLDNYSVNNNPYLQSSSSVSNNSSNTNNANNSDTKVYDKQNYENLISDCYKLKQSLESILNDLFNKSVQSRFVRNQTLLLNFEIFNIDVNDYMDDLTPDEELYKLSFDLLNDLIENLNKIYKPPSIIFVNQLRNYKREDYYSLNLPTDPIFKFNHMFYHIPNVFNQHLDFNPYDGYCSSPND